MNAAQIVGCAFGFLTPLPFGNTQLEPQHQGWMVAAFPLVGAAIGALMFAVAQLPIPPDTAALVVLVAWVLMTGAFHLDGVADFADGMGAAHASAERRLQIMKDSRVGAHGALALVVLALGKWLAIRGVLTAGAVALFVVPILSRAMLGAFIRAIPAASSQGLGHSFQRCVRWPHIVTALLVGVGPLLVMGAPQLWQVVIGMVVVCLLMGALALRALGGTNGDVYGAVVESTEVVGLILWGAIL